MMRSSPETIALQAGLTPTQSEVFFLHCEGCDEDEIARRLGLKVGTVRVRLCRAGQRIRAEAQLCAERVRFLEIIEAAEQRKAEGYPLLRRPQDETGGKRLFG